MPNNSKGAGVKCVVIRVIFVCLGNICRSPMAEAVFRHKVRAAGLAEQFMIDSAGTGDWHAGDPPHRGTRAVLAEHGIDASDMMARQIKKTDLAAFDYVMTMDNDNLEAVRALGPAFGVVRGLLDYSPDCRFVEVPDPYYTGGFGGVYGLIDGACDGLLKSIRKEHNF